MTTLRLHQGPAQANGRFPVTVVWHDHGCAPVSVDGVTVAGLDPPTSNELRWYFESFLDQL